MSYINGHAKTVVDSLNRFSHVDDKALTEANTELEGAIDRRLGEIIAVMRFDVMRPDAKATSLENEAAPLEDLSVENITQEIMKGANRSFYLQAALYIGGTIVMALATAALAAGAVAGITLSTIGIAVNPGLGAAGIMTSIIGGAFLIIAAGYATAGFGMLTISLFTGQLGDWGCMESVRIRVNTATPGIQDKLIAEIKEACITDPKKIKAILADRDLYQICLAKQKVENALNGKKMHIRVGMPDVSAD